MGWEVFITRHKALNSKPWTLNAELQDDGENDLDMCSSTQEAGEEEGEGQGDIFKPDHDGFEREGPTMFAHDEAPTEQEFQQVKLPCTPSSLGFLFLGQEFHQVTTYSVYGAIAKLGQCTRTCSTPSV